MCCHFFIDPNQVVGTNPVGWLLYNFVKKYLVIYSYIVKIISKTRTALNN